MSSNRSPRALNDSLYPQLARIGKAVSSPQRLELLDLLSHGEQSVERLAEQADLTIRNASAHLRVLREARLVEPRKEGVYVYYRLADEGVADFARALRDLAERRLAEVREVSRRYFGDRRRMTPVDRRQLLARIRTGAVIVLDLRDPAEFAAGHLPGARSVPMGELRKTLRAIPRDQEVVAYCHGPHCVLAREAVELLASKGYRASTLDEGLDEWVAAGQSLRRGSEDGR